MKTCVRCEISLCDEHIKDHLTLPAFTDHPLVKPLAEIPTRKCAVHKEEVASHYCQESESYACSLCTITQLVSTSMGKLFSKSLLERVSLDLKAGGGGNKLFLRQIKLDFLVCDNVSVVLRVTTESYFSLETP